MGGSGCSDGDCRGRGVRNGRGCSLRCVAPDAAGRAAGRATASRDRQGRAAFGPRIGEERNEERQNAGPASESWAPGRPGFSSSEWQTERRAAMVALKWLLVILGLALFGSAGALAAYDVYLASELRRLLKGSSEAGVDATRFLPSGRPVRWQRALQL